MSSRRWTSALAALGVAVALLPLPSALALAPDVDADAGPAATPPDRTVTLITGDRVSVVSRAGRFEPVRIEPGPDRADVVFSTDHTGHRLRVTPSDALPLLRAGRLDPRLFDVTALLDFGYDDRRGDLPLIVAGEAPGVRTLTARAVPGGTALRVPKDGLAAAWRDLTAGPGLRAAAASRIWLDGLRRPVLTESVPQVGAPAAWAAGYTGEGVTVGVVDSGVDD